MPEAPPPRSPRWPRRVLESWLRALAPLPEASLERGRGLLRAVMAEAMPSGFEDLGKILLHPALVGLAAGVVALLFLDGLELVGRMVPRQLAGYLQATRASSSSLSGVHRLR